MTFTFLHPEFFFWMVPPVVILFYFWQTQKPLASDWLSEKVLARLRAPETTMGLKGRNRLFLVAALALIGAMAQPVLIEGEIPTNPQASVVLLIDTASEELSAFDRRKSLAEALIARLAGEEIGVLAFDTRLYRVAPMSDDNAILAQLVRHLPRTSHQSDPEAAMRRIGSELNADAIVVVSDSFVAETAGVFMTLREPGDIEKVAQTIERSKASKRLGHHVPLFFYPLGLAMLLIWIALSSMSARRSVSVAVLAAALGLAQPPAAKAGVLDFYLLEEAERAYEEGAYERSAVLFERYQKSHDTPQVRYNRANALYKAGRYKQAEYWYERVNAEDALLESRRRFNLEQTRKQLLRIKERPRSEPADSAVSQTPLGDATAAPGRQEGFKTRLYRY